MVMNQNAPRPTATAATTSTNSFRHISAPRQNKEQEPKNSSRCSNHIRNSIRRGTMNNKGFAIAAAALGALIAFGSTAMAEKMTMKVDLTSAAEVPANTSPGKGTADINFDPATKAL